MSPIPSRRRFLAASVSAGAFTLAGCLSDAPTDDETETTTEETRAPEPRTDDLYVDNADGEERRVSVRLERRRDGEAVLDATYEVPALARIRIPDAGREGEAYDAVAAVGGEELAETWDVRTCEGTEAPRGNRYAEFRIEDGEPEFRENVCDLVRVEASPSRDHAEYRVEESGTTPE